MKRRFRSILSIGKVKRKGIFAVCILTLITITSGTVLAFQSTNTNVTESQNKTISFTLIAENKEWIRSKPITPEQMTATQHNLFEMPYGASESASFYASIGLDKAISYDPSPDYIRLLIIDSQIQSIKVVADNQIIIITEPASSGYQVISFCRTDMPSNNPLIIMETANGKPIDSLTPET